MVIEENGVMNIDVVINPYEIVVKGIATHNKAQDILYGIRDYIESRERSISIYFEGSPGPYGEGICLRIKVSGKPLDNVDITALKKFFNIIGAEAKVKM